MVPSSAEAAHTAPQPGRELMIQIRKKNPAEVHQQDCNVLATQKVRSGPSCRAGAFASADVGYHILLHDKTPMVMRTLVQELLPAQLHEFYRNRLLDSHFLHDQHTLVFANLSKVLEYVES